MQATSPSQTPNPQLTLSLHDRLTTIRDLLIAATILCILALIFINPAMVYVVFPGITDAAAGFVWVALYLFGFLCDIIALVFVIIILMKVSRVMPPRGLIPLRNTFRNLLVALLVAVLILPYIIFPLMVVFHSYIMFAIVYAIYAGLLFLNFYTFFCLYKDVSKN